MTSALQPPWAPCAEAPSEAEGAQVAWPRTHSAMEPRSVGFQVEGFHVLTFLSLSSPLCKDSRTSRPSLDSWGNRSSHPVVCSRVWLGTKNFCLRTLRACSPQPLETHWEPFTILLPKNPAPLLPTARPPASAPASASAPAQTWALHLPEGDAKNPAGAFLCPRVPEPQKATPDRTHVSPSDAEVH